VLPVAGFTALLIGGPDRAPAAAEPEPAS
jgi:hypothetical protein